MAGAGHGTVSAVSAAGGFTFFLIFDHIGNYKTYDKGKHKAYNDSGDICLKPCKHVKDFLSHIIIT